MESSKSDEKCLTRGRNGRCLSGLGLIEAIVLLDKGAHRGGRWKNREMRVVEMSGYRISLASKLAHRILGRKLRGLSPLARLLLLLIRKKSAQVDGDCTMSFEGIKEYSGWKKVLVKQCIEELRGRGYIEKKRSGYRLGKSPKISRL
jgi:hypothetical protein